MNIQSMVDLLNEHCPPNQEGIFLAFKEDPDKARFESKNGKWVKLEKGEAQIEPNIEAREGDNGSVLLRFQPDNPSKAPQWSDAYTVLTEPNRAN